MANTASLPFSSSLLASPETPPKFAALSVPALPLRNGLPRGGITEIAGLRSSGRTAAVLHILAQATARGEICAVVDTCDAFHPASAAAAGVKLARIVWVRCQGNVQHALRAADLLVHAGGFGVITLDLCEVTPRRRRAALLALGVPPPLASSMAGSGRGPWYLALTHTLHVWLSNAYFKSLGLPSLVEN